MKLRVAFLAVASIGLGLGAFATHMRDTVPVIAEAAAETAPSFDSLLLKLDEQVAGDNWSLKISIQGLGDVAKGVSMPMWPQLVNDEEQLLIERNYVTSSGTPRNVYAVAFTDGTSDPRGWKFLRLRSDGECDVAYDTEICNSMSRDARLRRFKAVDDRMTSVLAVIAPKT